MTGTFTFARAALATAAVLTLFACSGGCGGGARSEAEAVHAGPALDGTDPAGPPMVVGTTVDAGTGRPIEAALTAPDGTRGHSDASGRFVLRLAAGTSGPLEAHTEDGRRGRIHLRPLRGGRLEVVIHLRAGED